MSKPIDRIKGPVPGDLAYFKRSRHHASVVSAPPNQQANDAVPLWPAQCCTNCIARVPRSIDTLGFSGVEQFCTEHGVAVPGWATCAEYGASQERVQLGRDALQQLKKGPS